MRRNQPWEELGGRMFQSEELHGGEGGAGEDEAGWR